MKKLAHHNQLFEVALIGRRLPDNENLGLGYLQASLSQANVASRRYTLNEWRQAERVATEVIRRGCFIVGLSIPDGGSAFLPLALGELLRRRGYHGHITCGGSFATLARHWLLERYSWLDSVVRFAGETPLVMLVQALQTGSTVSSVPGLSTRAGDGPSAPVLDRTPMSLVPFREERPEILGYGVAHVTATRGCAGRCAYCGPSALQIQEIKEGLRAGLSSECLRQAGVGGVRRRNPGELCDEIAELWRDRDVRYFYFVDEHMLPYDEVEALVFLERFGRELKRRKVGPMGIGTMLRADRLTPAIVDAFAKVGLVRAFVGIEFATEQEARTYGRKAPGVYGLELLGAFEKAHVATVSNLMLVHPGSTIDTIARGIDYLESVPSGVFETTRMMVYHGTRLYNQMRSQGRLVGNPLRYEYRFTDPTVDRFRDIFVRLRAEAFWNHSIAYRTHDAFLALALTRRLKPHAQLSDIERRLDKVRRDVNQLYCESLRLALVLAQSGGGAWEAATLVTQARHKSLPIEQELQRCQELLAGSLQTKKQLFSPMRAAAANLVSFFVLGAASAACSESFEATETSDAATFDADRQPVAEGSFSDAATRDSASTDATASVEVNRKDVQVECNYTSTFAEQQQLGELVNQEVPCFSGNVLFKRGSAPDVSMYWLGNSINLCRDAPSPIVEERVASTEDAIASRDFPCLDRADYLNTYVSGGMSEDTAALYEVLINICERPEEVQIILDNEGKFQDVVMQNSGYDAALLQCVKTALQGLVFPCLAGMSVCPEYIIAE